VVDIDLSKFFDRVNHQRLLARVSRKVDDRVLMRTLSRIIRSSVVMPDGVLCRSEEGVPQGGPLSPLLSNLVLDQLDKELERRGHRSARYADDCNIYVASRRAAGRVLSSITRFLSRQLKLKVNEGKSAAARAWERTFLGFTFTRKHQRRKIGRDAINGFKDRVRKITQRTRGARLKKVVGELREYLLGWKGYFGYAEVRTVLTKLDSWIRRRLRSYLLKQWRRSRYRNLVRAHVSRDLAWNTTKSAHGPWRLSRSPAVLPFEVGEAGRYRRAKVRLRSQRLNRVVSDASSAPRLGSGNLLGPEA